MSEKRITPLKAIRAKCLDCCGGSSNEVKLCPCQDCSLYPFRLGKNPNRAGMVNSGTFKGKNNGSIKDIANEAATEGKHTTPTTEGENAHV